MRSIRTKITAVTIGVISVMMIIVSVIGITAIRNIGMRSSENMLLLLCEAGQKNLNSSLSAVQQDVENISAYVEWDLVSLGDAELQKHLDHVSEFFKKVIYRTNGIITYYYRIDPTISSEVKGFWYVNTDGAGFVEHEVTDITRYDTDDTSKLVWYTVPKATGKPVWLPPYITDNLGARVISYNMPVYLNGRFVGVIGIEMDYSFMAGLVNNLTLYENGYAFVNDTEGNLLYHPRMDVLSMETPPAIPVGLDSSNTVIRYRYEGEDKLLVSLPLINGDRLNVSAPMKEVNENLRHWTSVFISVFGLLVVALVLFFLRYTKKITKPLLDLTEVAKQIDEGNYDSRIEYHGDDEIGILARTFNEVTSHLKKHITNLNDLAFADALTSVRNKAAFDVYIESVQTRLSKKKTPVEFAVCMFDCNSLKKVNDQNGHDKGDIYLKETAAIICEVFKDSPVFRIGGDEFAVLLLGSDYMNRDELLSLFDTRCDEKRKQGSNAWEQVNVARGMAVYDPDDDNSVNDVVRRADKKMYENKWREKSYQEGTE